MLGIGQPIGGHAQYAADLESTGDQFEKGVLHDATLVVPLLVPWVGKQQQYLIQAGWWQLLGKHLDGVMAAHSHIGEAVLRHQMQQVPDTWRVYFDADEVRFGSADGQSCQMVTIAKADLQHARSAAPEQQLQIQRLRVEGQAKARPEFVHGFLLAGGHAASAHDETANGPQARCGG